jgi:isoamylase
MTTALASARRPIQSNVLDALAKGSGSPLGATPSSDGVNFSIYSKHATGIELLLFDHVDDAKAARAIRIDPATNRTYHYWHLFVPGVSAGQIYGYRVDGPHDPTNGMRFDPTKVLLDPYGRGVAVPGRYRRSAAVRLATTAHPT